MATQYDFQDLERQITSLEKDFSKFESSFDSTLSSIYKANFNEAEYGERAVSKKITEIVDSAKRKISSIFSDYVNGIRRAVYDSTSRIKKAANSAALDINDLNSLLQDIEELNCTFSEKCYQGVIDARLNSDSYPPEVAKYIVYLKLESYQAICQENLSRVAPQNYNVFLKYHSMCEANKAEKHLLKASGLLFYASCEAVSSSAFPSNDLYGICINGLTGYKNMPVSEQSQANAKYEVLYQKAINLFNDGCQKAYASFDYVKVKQLLGDSVLFKNSDIQNTFFKDSVASPEKMFSYAKQYSRSASTDVMKIVFEDTKALASTAALDDYLSFWISRYDETGYSFIDQIIEIQPNRFDAHNAVCSALSENQQYVTRLGSCYKDIVNGYCEYLKNSKNSIPLLRFCKVAISWGSLIHAQKHFSSSEEQERYNKAVESLDGLAFSMITKYQKYCNCFDTVMISELNRVLDDASNRLFGHSYKKDLQKSEITNCNPEEIKVKLVSVQQQKENRKKAFIIGGIAVGLLVVALIIWLITK